MVDSSRSVAPPYVHFFSGWLGASLSCVLLSPLEVIKTRQQSAAAGAVRLRADVLARDIFAVDGIRGFYRGLVPHLLGVGPARAFYFGGYALAKAELSQGAGGNLSGAPLHLTAAALASIVSATLMSPVWVIKTRLQLAGAPQGRREGGGGAGGAATGGGGGGAVAPATPGQGSAAAALCTQTVRSAQSERPYKGIADAFRRVYAEEGIGAFYRGLSASYLGVAETALQFALYSELKERVVAARRRSSSAAQPLAPYPDAVAFWTSAAAKLIAAVATYPHEVLRTRMRERGGDARYAGIVKTTQRILREEGVRGLYGGMTVHLLRTVPNAAILLMVVEKLTGGGL